MAEAKHTEIFHCTPDEFFKIVTDYEKYPDFLSEVKSCKVLKNEGGEKLVEYKVSVVKSFTYQILLKEEKPSLVSWAFAGGDIFNTMSGSWKIAKESEGKCRVVYSVEGTFKIAVPKFVEKSLLNANLPAMMSAYHKRIKKVYGK